MFAVQATRNENGKHKGQKFFFFFLLFRHKIDKSLTNTHTHTHDIVWLWVNICKEFFESVQVLSMRMRNIWCRTVNIARIDIEDLSLPAYKVKVYSSFCERFENCRIKRNWKSGFLQIFSTFHNKHRTTIYPFSKGTERTHPQTFEQKSACSKYR